MIPLLFDTEDCQREEREPPTAMQIIGRSRKESRLALAFATLLRELEQWISIRGVSMETERMLSEIGEVAPVWRTGFKGDGPATEIMEANKREPLLWWDALPPDVVVIPKSTLKMLCDEAAAAGEEVGVMECAQRMGAYSVENHAARARAEWEEKQRDKRYGRRLP